MADIRDIDEDLLQEFGPHHPKTAHLRARARHSDPGTSHAAAASVKKLTESQQAVMQCIRMMEDPTVMPIDQAGKLDEEIISYYNKMRGSMKWPKQGDSGIRSRRAELARAGRIREGIKMRMSTGRLGRTWKVGRG